MSFPYERLGPLRCGGVEEGFDRGKFDGLFEEAARFVSARFGARPFPFATANDYFYARIAGEDAQRTIETHERVYAEFLRPLRELSTSWSAALKAGR
jgi:hypothetical protein